MLVFIFCQELTKTVITQCHIFNGLPGSSVLMRIVIGCSQGRYRQRKSAFLKCAGRDVYSFVHICGRGDGWWWTSGGLSGDNFPVHVAASIDKRSVCLFFFTSKMLIKCTLSGPNSCQNCATDCGEFSLRSLSCPAVHTCTRLTGLLCTDCVCCTISLSCAITSLG